MPTARTTPFPKLLCFLALLTLSATLQAQVSDEAPDEQSEPSAKAPGAAAEIFVEGVPVRVGEDRCIVCSTPLSEGDTVYLLEGQRVGIMKMMEPELRSDPWAYIARLKPRGGLFGGEMAPPSVISDAWLLLGVYVTLGLGFAAVCAHRAINTGHGPVPWFFVGLFLNAFGYLALLLRSADSEKAPPKQYSGVTKVPTTSEPQSCPECGRLNHPSAAECLGCHASLHPAGASEVTQLAAQSK